METIELHAWNSLVSDPKKPDRLIFDLDPAPDVVPWDEVRNAAKDLRAALKKLQLVSFLKTTGGKGLHLVVPFAPGPAWAEAKAVARGFCEVLASCLVRSNEAPLVRCFLPLHNTPGLRKRSFDARVVLFLRNQPVGPRRSIVAGSLIPANHRSMAASNAGSSLAIANNVNDERNFIASTPPNTACAAVAVTC